MRAVARHVVFVALVSGFFSLCGVRANHDVAQAQRRTPVTVTRLYTGPDGQTHAEDVDVKLSPSTGAAGGAERSALVNVSSVQFQRTPANQFQDWHNAPQRQYVVTVSGRREAEIAGGKRVILEPGRIILAEDLTGKGHITRGAGTEDAVTLIIALRDE
jgi:hypothetical protein